MNSGISKVRVGTNDIYWVWKGNMGFEDVIGSIIHNTCSKLMCDTIFFSSDVHVLAFHTSAQHNERSWLYTYILLFVTFA